MSEFQTMTGPQPVKLTVEDYELLLRSGALDRYQHVELIEGVIVEMNAERVRHSSVKMGVTFRLHDALKDEKSVLEVRCEPTIKLSSHSLTEPDIIVIEPLARDSDYIEGKSVRIVVEVAHGSRLIDLRYKHDLYGRFGLPEYWVFDLNEDKVHIFWEPFEQGYRQQHGIALGERLDSRTIPGLSIQTASLY